jgi:hypothetical protein
MTREEILKVTGLSIGVWDAWVIRDRIALAWGRSRSKKRDTYEPLDLIALALIVALGGLLDRKAAATVVRHYWALWIDVLRRVEAEGPDAPPGYFYVGLRETDAGPLLWAGGGALPEIVQELKELRAIAPDEVPTVGCQTDLKVIADAVREMAGRAGVALPDKFFDMDPDLFEAMVREDNRRRLREEKLRRPRPKPRRSKRKAAPILRDLPRRAEAVH